MAVRLVDGKLVDDETNAPVDPVAETVTEIPSPESSATADGYPLCEGCGAVNYEWQPGTRGRKPKWHKDCKPVSPNRSAGGGGTGRVSFRNEAALREALLGRYHMLGSLFAMVHPAYAESVRQNAERAVDADIAYARVNPSFRKHIESFCEKTAAGEVIAVHVAMFSPVVLGEYARRKRQAPRPQARTQSPGGSPPPPGRAQPRNDETARQSPIDPQADNVTRLRPPSDMPGEDRGPDETVNAGAMPGMPG